ncbi:MAG: hypothetical protein CMJ42_20995 [Phyllobacteriaceae bacterium]|nr:hypothetical protein [Phyllobacteriaceae bacterium]MBA90813.1 hypothetical protein [Phyllobacteriaceae bacterium]
MAMTRITDEERAELSLLLPWHAAGTLEPAEARRVEAALKADSGLAAEYALVLEDREATRELAAAEAVPSSMQARFDAALSARVAGDSRRAARQAVMDAKGPGIFARLFGGLFDSPRMAFAATAAVLVILVQGGAILALLGDRAGPEYRTASGETVPADGLQVLLRFAPGLSMDDAAAWLEERGARIVEGPLPGGLFRVAFPGSAAGDASELAERLTTDGAAVVLALPSG